MDARQQAQSTTQPTESAVITWLQANVLPLHHVEAGNGFADLQPLHEMLKEVKVVGLGETTHGTRGMPTQAPAGGIFGHANGLYDLHHRSQSCCLPTHQ